MSRPHDHLIVIASYERFGYVARAVDSALAHTPGAVVAVVDDGSPCWADPKAPPPQLAAILKRELVTGRFVTIQFERHAGSLTRSWNQGIWAGLKLGSSTVTVANSDVLFTPGWFEAVEDALDGGFDLAGPVTNAPGHRPAQWVGHYCPGYKLTDDPAYLAGVAAGLKAKYAGKPRPADTLNGFCLTARAAAWRAGAFAFEEGHFFNPKFAMVKNEDELEARWRRLGMKLAVVPASFVFHYRGVSRKGGTSGRQGSGWYRPDGECAANPKAKKKGR